MEQETPDGQRRVSSSSKSVRKLGNLYKDEDRSRRLEHQDYSDMPDRCSLTS
jgi:hypothetical protein